MSPKVTVIIPAYNRAAQIVAAVESVLAQSIPVAEVIVVDDGSVDGTSNCVQARICTDSRWQANVRYFRQENRGPAAARNTGIQHAKGEWLAFNDADDLWLPQKLERQFEALTRFEECGACFSDAWFMNNPSMKMTLFQLAGRQSSEMCGIVPDPPLYLAERGVQSGIHPVWVQTLLVKAELARRVGGFDSELLCGEDDDFLFRLGCETKFCFVGCPLVLIERTPADQRHEGMSRQWDQTEFRLRMSQSRFEKRLSMGARLAPPVRDVVRKDLSNVHSAWANWYLSRGQYNEARRSIARAARLHLSPGIAIKWCLTFTLPVLARKAVLMREAQRLERTAGLA